MLRLSSPMVQKIGNGDFNWSYGRQLMILHRTFSATQICTRIVIASAKMCGLANIWILLINLRAQRFEGVQT